MTNGSEPVSDGQPTVEQAALAADAPAPGPPAAPDPAAAFTPAPGLFPEDRPEFALGAAFAGGAVLAFLLKRLAR